MMNYATIRRNPNDDFLKLIIKTFLSTLAILGFCIVVFGGAGYSETHYSTVATVYSIEDDSILLIDGAGYIWEITDRPELHKGDFVKIKFFNNATDYTREDDEILSVKMLDK